MSNSDLTIIINTFKSEEQIHSCLDSIGHEFKILIVENSNNNEFKTTIEKKYPNVTCKLTGENLGYAKGNNFGLSKVDSRFALILNPDTLLHKDTLKNFLSTASKLNDFAILAPAIQEKKDLISSNKIEKVVEVNTVKGFAMFLNLKEFKDIGYFDENFFIYFEEIDLCRRLKNNDKKIYLDPNIKISHVGGSSHNQSINFEMELSRNWHWMWSTFYFHKKYNGFMIGLLKVSKKLISSVFKVAIYSILLNNKKRKIYFQRFSGLYNSILGRKSWYRPRLF